MKSFFENSKYLDRFALRPLSHIKGNWELTWDYDSEADETEEDSYAEMLNNLIEELGQVQPSSRYHDNEDRLAEFVQANLNWNILKVGNRWVGEDYSAILEQGGFDDIDEANLILAVAGRIKAAVARNQLHFDDMEESHQKMLSAVLSIILYHRS